MICWLWSGFGTIPATWPSFWCWRIAPRGSEGQYIRRFLTEDGYAQVLDARRQGRVRIYKHANIIEGHIIPAKPKKRRGK